MARMKLDPDLAAFLDTIAWSEGTTRIQNSDDGYNVLVGGQLFDDYDDHPRILVHVREGLSSTAAGRYQILKRTFDAYAKRLGLSDFSPESQDKIACQLIKEERAMSDITKGNIAEAIAKCSNIWASLPGAGYGQHENKMESLLVVYKHERAEYGP